MQKPTEGTERWFEVARRQCVDHLRALLSIRMAHDYMNVILGNFENCHSLVASGLHSASVIAYGRPFTPTKTKIGKVAYNIAALKRVEGFDRQLHAHLLEIRNRLIAHADYDVLNQSPGSSSGMDLGDGNSRLTRPEWSSGGSC